MGHLKVNLIRDELLCSGSEEPPELSGLKFRCALGSKQEGSEEMKWAKAILQLSCDDAALPETTKKKNIRKR